MRALHLRYGNVNTTGRYIVQANGAQQLLSALCLALSLVVDPSQRPLQLYERPPVAHSLLPLLPMLNPSLLTSFSSDNNNNNHNNQNPSSSVLELLSFPAGPSHPAVPADALQVVDLTWHWPHFSQTWQQFSGPVLAFDLQGISGHSATRFAWAIVEDPQVAALAREFVVASSNTISVTSRNRALSIASLLASPSSSFTEDIRAIMARRWDRLEDLLSAQRRFSLLSSRLAPFLWLRCLSPADAANCSAIFSAVGLETSDVDGGDTVSVSILQWTYAFEVLFSRLSFLCTQAAPPSPS